MTICLPLCFIVSTRIDRRLAACKTLASVNAKLQSRFYQESAVVAKEDEAQPRKLLKRIGGGAKAAQTKLGKGVLVVVASALLGVALLPF